jgi:hypothetical protein
VLLLQHLQIPQYYRNYKTKSAEALSPWFLAQWLLVRVYQSGNHHIPEAVCCQLCTLSTDSLAVSVLHQQPCTGLTVTCTSRSSRSIACRCQREPEHHCCPRVLQGDTFNLIGALLQGQQLPTTVYTAM